MQHKQIVRRLAAVLAVGLVAAACGSDDEPTTDDSTTEESSPSGSEPDTASPTVPATSPPTSESVEESPPGEQAEQYEGEVAALVVRRVTGDLDEFTSTRDAYVAELESQVGIGADREFQPFLSFLTFAEPEPPVYIGLTQGDSLAEFGAAAESIDQAVQGAYFPTFEIETFGLVRPLDGDVVTIDDIAVEPGQVLEVAWRDLSAYDDFDESAYESARDAYLTELSAFDGWVAEYQWVSVDGQNLAVGMTVYENAERFQAIATDPDFTASQVYADFVGAYPIAGGYASYSVKPEATPPNTDGEAAVDLTDDVAALIVRRVSGDLDEFTSTRDAYVADLESQVGIGADREFEPFLSFLTFAEPDPPVYIGLTQGDSLAEFGAAADSVDPALQEAYFPTFEIEVFDLLTPAEPGTPVDISQISVEPGQVLEIAWRDLSTYDDFDQLAYESARDAYLAELSAFDGWVAEYQWVSAAGSTFAVGMTVYENAERFQVIATDPDFTASQVYADFVGAYPIAGGYASIALK